MSFNIFKEFRQRGEQVPVPAETAEAESFDVDRMVERFDANEDVLDKAKEIVFVAREPVPGENPHLAGLLEEFKTLIAMPELPDKEAQQLAYALEATTG